MAGKDRVSYLTKAGTGGILLKSKGGMRMPKRNKTAHAYEYEQNYIKENIKFVSVPFNLKHDDEKELYAWLQAQKDSGQIKSIGGFIKNFLLGEMKKNAQ